QVRSGKSVGNSLFCGNSSNIYGTIDKNPVALEQLFKLSPCVWEFFEELVQFLESLRTPVALEPSDASHVCGQARTAYFFVYLVNLFAELEHVKEAGISSGLHTEDRVTDQVIGNPREFHHNHTQILCAFRHLNPEKFFDRHPPSHIVD